MTRRGDWFVTYSGRPFWPFDARVDDVHLEDIAHSLAHQCRWNGHCRFFYSVAAHSVACSQQAATVAVARWALLHDAAEAYLTDVPTPVKRFLCVKTDGQEHGYGVVEDGLLKLIGQRFDLPWPPPKEVWDIDRRMLVTEALALTNYREQPHWTETETRFKGLESYPVPLIEYMPEEAKRIFLDRFSDLFPLHTRGVL